ncbi:hypothetical protein Tco_0769254 [Tanacetum coccineum]|uniref:Uncharacterized protein n=1 Tax=Tanacetum coccineum TaxID=301880 RepID=A0ABQ4ZCQ4_9ASTR
MDKSESYLATPEHRECYKGLIKSYDLEKTIFSTYGKMYSLKRSRKDKDKDEDPFAGSDRGLKKRKTSKDAEPTKEEPEFEVANFDMPQDQEENPSNDDEEPKEKVASKRDWFLLKLPMINMRYEESHIGDNNVEVMRKHGYGYLKEIVNRLTNLSGDDVFDFAIALRMFTRSLVIQKRVEDLQLRVKSYQKKINVTKPETTKSGIRKRDPYTPYQDPQGFIYVDNNGRNRLMRSDELYKFSDRTLTGLRTSLDDITKNIRMEYLPKRRWSTLEKKRANIMIKAIDKQLKERRLMRSLEKFVGGRHYETDLRLLQRTI